MGVSGLSLSRQHAKLSVIGFLFVGLVFFRGCTSVPQSAMAEMGEKDTGRNAVLSRALSLYLRQHADNPVRWRVWSAEAFQEARQRDVPVFLSIGYSSCYWCHVMEEESFMDQEVARLLNEHFVPIKVDREELPDVDEYYMRAVLILNRGRAGWPLSVFLTPEGKPFAGGTYFPKKQFIQILNRVWQIWQERREEVESVANQVVHLIGQFYSSDARQPDWAFLSDPERHLLEALQNAYDERFGGFGTQPKFPPHTQLHYLLFYYGRTRDASARTMLLNTLAWMARGGIHDHVGGGFHRYATDRKWLVPHFEKMLYDQVQLFPLYVWAWRETQDELYRYAFEGILRFLQTTMRDSQTGCFYSAVDALTPVPTNPDHYEEGAYYLWMPREIQALLGEDDASSFMEVFGMKGSPTFVNHRTGYEGYILHLLYVSPESVPWVRVRRWLDQLRNVRAGRPAPRVDRKILAGWNGLAIYHLVQAYRFLPESTWLDMAARCARFLLERMVRDRRLYRVWYEGQVGTPGKLEDYAYVVAGLVALSEVTGDLAWLQGVKPLFQYALRAFRDPESGAFTPGKDAPFGLWRTPDGVLPSPEAMLAYAALLLDSAVALDILFGYRDFLLTFPEASLTLWMVAFQLVERGELTWDEMRDGESVLEVERVWWSGDDLLVACRVRQGWHVLAEGVPEPFQSLEVRIEEEGAPVPIQIEEARQRKELRVDQQVIPVVEGNFRIRVGGLRSRRGGAGSRQSLPQWIYLFFQACTRDRCLPVDSLRIKVPPDDPLPQRRQ